MDIETLLRHDEFLVLGLDRIDVAKDDGLELTFNARSEMDDAPVPGA